MRILIICPAFPPENKVAAIRVGKFAKYLAADGVDVQVLTKRFPNSVDDVAINGFEIVRIKDPFLTLETHVKRTSATAVDESGSRWRGWVRSSRFLRFRRAAVRALLWPDRYGIWAFRAWRDSKELVRRPDVILASSPPFSSLILGAALARRFGVPWVADYRDLLTFGTYYDSSGLRRWVDRRIELKTTRTAAACITVSAPLARDLAAGIGRPVEVILNGFDPDDFELAPVVPSVPSDELVLTHCGEIYPGRRDPSPLFAAMAQLRKRGIKVRARFFGDSSSAVESLALEYGVRDMVDIRGRVPHLESLSLQVASDVLLLLMWNDPGEEGVFTGKVFEYLGARRPILVLGYEESVAAQLIRERRAGVVLNEASLIADHLEHLWALKVAGRLGRLEPAVSEGITRQEQTARLHTLLKKVAPAPLPGS